MTRWCLGLAIAVFTFSAPACAVEPQVTLQTVADPGPNRADEPTRANYSENQALHFLDSVALNWQKQRKCFSCHTNYAYLYSRPMFFAGASPDNSTAHTQVRAFAEQLVEERWQSEGPRWDAEVIATAAALAFNDSQTAKRLHPTTRSALERMWTLQRDDGGWDWLKCDWPPFEYDDHYGVTLAAIAIGVAPDDYVSTEKARKGMEGIRRYLSNHPPENLHHQAMLLWASKYHPDLLDGASRCASVDALLSRQLPDGGWSSSGLGDWSRDDGTEQTPDISDGYGTGFVVFALRQAGVPKNHPKIEAGVEWLRSHQRESGRWFTRSLYRDGNHFLTHAGSAFAMMAIAVCD